MKAMPSYLLEIGNDLLLHLLPRWLLHLPIRNNGKGGTMEAVYGNHGIHNQKGEMVNEYCYSLCPRTSARCCSRFVGGLHVAEISFPSSILLTEGGRGQARLGWPKNNKERKHTMLNIDLLPRPWSGHHPRQKGFSPLIKAEIGKVSSNKKVGWRCQILVNDVPMFTSHHPTKSWAEHKAGDMLRTYTDAHYISK